MKKKTDKPQDTAALRREYNSSQLKGGVRGKYTERFRAGTNLELLARDVAAHFPDERSVNAARRSRLRISKPVRRRAR
jgi:hypothetical protein